jgi:hypothetical protein
MTIFMKDEVREQFGVSHNEKPPDLYRSPGVAGVLKCRPRWAGYVARMGRQEIHTGFWWRNLLIKCKLGSPRRRWKDRIKMHLNEIGCADGRGMELAQDRVQWRALVLAVSSLRVLLRAT